MPLHNNLTSLMRVRLGDTMIGLPAMAVREIVRAVAITPIAGAPALLEGAVNVRGQLVPVIDLRARLALAPKSLDPDEFLVVIEAGTRTLAFRVDGVDDVVDIDSDSVAASATLSPALSGLAGLAAGASDVLVLYDPEAFVSQAEGEAIDAAVAARA